MHSLLRSPALRSPARTAAALAATWCAAVAGAQESRPESSGHVGDAKSAERPSLDGLGELAVHVLDEAGRPWRPAKAHGAAVLYRGLDPQWEGENTEGFFYPWVLHTDGWEKAPLDERGNAALRVKSRSPLAGFVLHDERCGTLIVENPATEVGVARALCLRAVRRLRVRYRTALGTAVSLGSMVFGARTESGPALFARTDPVRKADGSFFGPSDGYWSRGVLCPDAPLTVSVLLMSRMTTMEVPAACTEYEAPLTGLGEATFMLAAHRGSLLLDARIEPVPAANSTPTAVLGFGVHQWIDEQPVRDGVVDRRRAALWPGRYRIRLEREDPFEFEVRPDEAVEVPLP